MITAATVLVFVGLAFLVSTIVSFVAVFSRAPVAETIIAESSPRGNEQVEQQRQPQARHRDRERIDRDDVYVGVLIALWFAGLGIVLAPIGAGAIATLEFSTQKLLAVCMMFGSSIALLGSASGRPTLKVTWPLRMASRPIGRLFGQDVGPVEVRNAYLMGAAGLIAFNVSLLVLASTIVTNSTIVGTATGILTPILFVVYTKKMRKLFGEFRRLSKAFNEVKEAVTRDVEAGEP